MVAALLQRLISYDGLRRSLHDLDLLDGYENILRGEVRELITIDSFGF